MGATPKVRVTPALRVHDCNGAPTDPDGEYVLYWMTAARRLTWNHALDRAVDHAIELGKPLIVLEALRVGYRWASDRLHRFILDGMADNAVEAADTPALYFPYVETTAGEGSGLLEALAERACVVVTDDYPCFFIPRMLAATAPRLKVRTESVDSNGLLPMAVADHAYPTAYAFRRFLHKTLPDHLGEMPSAEPLRRPGLPQAKSLPPEIASKWPQADAATLAGNSLDRLPIDHTVAALDQRGGARAAAVALDTFTGERLARYATTRNAPEEEVTSGLSPYLHFGHISSHEIFARIAHEEGWSPSRLAERPSGKRAGWWGMSETAEAFLDQIVTWREVGFNMCRHRQDYDRFDSLPDWALATLAKHEADKREHVYTFDEIDGARTHDALWNAAQTQLVREGRIHNYLRMLWGKKVLEWSATPAEALETLLELNNRYALDGRDPNSYSGIFWCFGRYDRAWGPERPIFGTVRFMSSDNTARKFKVRRYLEIYGPNPRLL